jgi:hypothetical protein
MLHSLIGALYFTSGFRVAHGKERECSTICEVKRRKSARNRGIDQEDAGETAPHLGYQHAMVEIHRSRSRLPRPKALECV